jgi:O-methyltransferase involved in polyketide biosynthesis
VQRVDATVPNIARVYDYLLGGRTNFAADRDLAKRLLIDVPQLVDMARENKVFLTRAVSWVAALGIGQFIDLGCGLPTMPPSTLDAARASNPDAQVRYIDNDPVVISHLEAFAAKGGSATIVNSDLRDIDAVLAGLDREVPACLVAGCIMHFFPADDAAELIAQYVDALATGSYLIVTVGRPVDESGMRAARRYQASGADFHAYSEVQISAFFKPLTLLPPGIADVRTWRPGQVRQTAPPRPGGDVLAGVGRKP